jgi:hypothetical protein
VAQLPPAAAATPLNWNEHVGDTDLGLIDAPIVEDVPNLRTAGFLPAPVAQAPVEERVVEQPFVNRPVPGNQPIFPGGSVRPIVPPPPGPAPVAPVPEPETYAMLLSGLGLLGFAARRKRRAAAAAAAKTA